MLNFTHAQCAPDTLLHSIPNPAPAPSDFFGNSVGVSGNLVIVGAQSDDAGASAAVVGAWRDGAGAMNAGSAYILSCTPTPDELLIAYLLGYTANTAGIDLNADAAVDVADLLLN